jgi:DNA-binding MarR family transcriptional regulator
MNQDHEIPEIAHASVLAAELRALLGKLRRRLREQADSRDLTPSQASVLLRLEREGPATVSALARGEGVRPQSMGATVATLEAAGLVGGEVDPNDGRQTILSLTKACRTWIGEARAARHDWLTRNIETKLSPEEQDALAKGVELLKRLAGD